MIARAWTSFASVAMVIITLGGCASSPPPEAREAREATPAGGPTVDRPVAGGGASDAPATSPASSPTASSTTPSAPTASSPAPSTTARPAPSPSPSAQSPQSGAPASTPSASLPAPTTTPNLNPIETARHIHDPAIIRQGDWFYCFSTGNGIPIHRSRDLVTWEPVGRVFVNDVPPWAKEIIPTSVNVWAPDIQFIDGRYVLTYTVATFGQNRSLIGMASTPTLDPAARGYRWRNDGKVVESFVGDDYNAIDSNIYVEGNRAVVFFGSYWTGVKMVELDRQTFKPRENAPRVSIARRETSGGIEAPYVVKRDGWYYAFLAFDKCCAGVESTYNVRVGRSRTLEGPYYDRDNKPLMRGGGTRVLESEGRIIGPGHCCIFRERVPDAGRWFIGYHFYDGDASGTPTLQVRELLWDHLGWPRAGAAIGGV